MLQHAGASVAPWEHDIVRWVSSSRKNLFEEMTPGYLHGRKGEGGVVVYNSHFHAVVARLIKDSILKVYKYIWILFKSRIKVSIMVLGLWSRVVDPHDDVSPLMLKAVGLNSTIKHS